MDDQEDGAGADSSNCYPAFLVVKCRGVLRKSIRIIKNQDGSFKANPVFAKVVPVFALVPLKSHCRPHPHKLIAKRS